MKRKLEVDILSGSRAIFVNERGVGRDLIITHVWETNTESLPLVNFGSEFTSVPHKSSVPGASGFYYQVVI